MSSNNWLINQYLCVTDQFHVLNHPFIKSTLFLLSVNCIFRIPIHYDLLCRFLSPSLIKKRQWLYNLKRTLSLIKLSRKCHIYKGPHALSPRNSQSAGVRQSVAISRRAMRVRSQAHRFYTAFLPFFNILLNNYT